MLKITTTLIILNLTFLLVSTDVVASKEVSFFAKKGGESPFKTVFFKRKKVKHSIFYNKIAHRKSHKNNKATAIALAILLGPFGVHRLYLGTDPKVPVIYTLTLGGGIGVLPFTDIIAILIAKDISVYEKNNRIIMWAKPE